MAFLFSGLYDEKIIISHGCGGCFEINMLFFELLKSLGYKLLCEGTGSIHAKAMFLYLHPAPWRRGAGAL